MIVNISGPSGSGKSTIVDYLVKEYPLTYSKLIPYTSRQKRSGEKDDIDYHFVSRDFFNNSGNFILQRDREDGFYAIKKEDLFLFNKNILLTTLPPKGVLKIEELGFVVKCFYLLISSIDCKNRMINRGDKIDKIEKRLLDDVLESSLDASKNILLNKTIFILDGYKPVTELGSLIHEILLV